MNTQTAGAERHDVVVVGTGFGGAVAACRLAQHGLSPLVLERGRRYEAADFPGAPAPGGLLPDVARWAYSVDQGLWDPLDLGEIVSVQAAGYGGGSLVYANVHLRAPAEAMDAPWPRDYRGDALDPWHDLVARMLDPAPYAAAPELPKRRQLEGAFAALGRGTGRGTFRPPLAIRQADGPNPASGLPMRACTGCGACITGCPERAKNTLDWNYLALAERHGARVLTQHEVVRIARVADGDMRFRVDVLDHLAARPRQFLARDLFLCAGSVHSTRLLATAELGEDPAGVKARVGVGYSPGADSIGVVFDTTEPSHPEQGPTITTALVVPDPGESGAFSLIEDGGYAEAFDRVVGTFRAPLLLGRNRATSAAAPPRAGQPPRQQDALPSVPSPLDALLDALAPGRARAPGELSPDVFLPGQLADSFAPIREQLRQVILLPEVAGGTVARLLRDGYQRRLVSRLPGFSPDGPVGRAILRLLRWLVAWAFGDDEAISRVAFGELTRAGGLDRHALAARWLGYAATGARHRLVLLGMGRDAAPGQLRFTPGGAARADLDLYQLTPGYSAAEGTMSAIARHLGGELRTSPLWASLGKPITVHSQGGCPMSEDPALGVTDPDGRVHGIPGLRVLDGAVFPRSVGVNPSATIAAVAERNVARYLEGHAGIDRSLPGVAEYAAQRAESLGWASRHRDLSLRPPLAAARAAVGATPPDPPLGVEFSEVLEGYLSPADTVPAGVDACRAAEAAGRPAGALTLDLSRVAAVDLRVFLEDAHHRMVVEGEVTLALPGDRAARHPVKGHLELLVPRRKPGALFDAPQPPSRVAALAALGAREPGVTVAGAELDSAPRRLEYVLEIGDGRYLLRGTKRVADDPGPDAWRDTTELAVTLYERCPPPSAGGEAAEGAVVLVRAAGIAHADLRRFLERQLRGLRVTGGQGPDDPRIAWALARFAAFFFGTLERVYLPGPWGAVARALDPDPGGVRWAARGDDP